MGSWVFLFWSFPYVSTTVTNKNICKTSWFAHHDIPQMLGIVLSSTKGVNHHSFFSWLPRGTQRFWCGTKCGTKQNLTCGTRCGTRFFENFPKFFKIQRWFHENLENQRNFESVVPKSVFVVASQKVVVPDFGNMVANKKKLCQSQISRFGFVKYFCFYFL